MSRRKLTLQEAQRVIVLRAEGHKYKTLERLFKVDKRRLHDLITGKTYKECIRPGDSD